MESTSAETAANGDLFDREFLYDFRLILAETRQVDRNAPVFMENNELPYVRKGDGGGLLDHLGGPDVCLLGRQADAGFNDARDVRLGH
jgi:hypothetical protein